MPAGLAGGGSCIGARMPDMDTLQGQFAAQSQNVDEVLQGLGACVETTEWVGNAASAFRANWETRHRPALVALANELTASSAEARGRAIRLEEADSGAGVA